MIEPLLDGHSVYRRVTLTPAMCGHNSLFLAQVGEWMWSTVSRTCGTEMYREKNESGSPTYLSFYYLCIHGGPAMQMHQFTYGDVVDVVTTAYNVGSESILTLHRVARAVPDGAPPRAVTPLEFYEQREDGCLYVEALNRWIARSGPGNEALVKSSPAGMTTPHLPLLPDRYSPRAVYDAARRAETFHDVASPDYEPVVEEYTVDYTIDAARDLNGVGLVFFASFASIVDSSLLKLWKHLGRDTHSFINRVVRDRQLGYTANVDVDATVRLTLRSWRRRDDPHEEVFNVVIRDARNRLVLVATLQIGSDCGR